MTTEADINDAVAQLEMLGIDKKKALKALSRYNYSVERAADYVFSGNAESDDEISTNDTRNNNSTDWPWAEPNSFDDVSFTVDQQSSAHNTTLDSMDLAVEKTPVHLVKDYEKNPKNDDGQVTHASMSWSVVPFTATDKDKSTLPHPKPEKASLTQSSLTWWSDPTDPSARAAIADIPPGLRPPSYNFAYSPIIIQALFHIPLFRWTVLSFRPTPHTWGEPQNYWKGFGEPVPGYRRRSSPLSTNGTVIPNLMDASIDENVQNDTDYMESQHAEDNDDTLVPLTKDQLALAELQKLFAFLGNTTRLYGSVAHYMRAINTRTVTSSTGWQVDDKSIDDFLDSVIGGLLSAEGIDGSGEDGRNATNEYPGLEKLFFLRAEVDNGLEVDIEDINYLNLGINASMTSFHDCLDPLVYESYPASNDNDDDEEDLGSTVSDNEQKSTHKMTSFLQVPPILLVTLEDRREYLESRDKHNDTFTVDKVLYMDRYLNENKKVALEKYRLADQWKQDIRRTREELISLDQSGPSLPLYNDPAVDSSSLSKCDLLEATTKYLDSQVNTLEWTDENEAYIKSIRSLQQVLYQVRDDIENKRTELQNLICERQVSLQNLFNEPDLQKRPYDLHAVLHTDGLSGPGHYWGYIWVDQVEVNLLEDIPSQGGGWYRFCDAKVEKVTEEEVWRESTKPFALVYTDRCAPLITKQQIDEVTPADLMQFVQADNTAFGNEIDNMDNNNISDQNSIQRADSRLSIETDRGSIMFDNDNHHTDGETMPQSGLLDLAAINMGNVKSYTGEDYRLLKKFDTFLARAGDIQTLARYYELVESRNQILPADEHGFTEDPPRYDQDENHGQLNDILDTLFMNDIRPIIRSDKTLFLLFELYEQYLSMAQTVATALGLFVDDNISGSLEHLVKSCQQHDSWRTQLTLNDGLLWKYHGLGDLGFDLIAIKYGMACIKRLNSEAYTKACNLVTRSSGLKEGIRVANQVQWVIKRDDNRRETFLGDLAQPWLDFTEHQSGLLTEDQVELLNNLVMIYLDGTTTTTAASVGPDDASLFSVDSVDSMHEDEEPVWINYRQSLWDAESKLSD
ncbi:hypothetical protein BC941DRAFT_497811 [Chlamydoabsidia padenii]|nr:hypothetical protein BC941DRAFT_497811 [Chlamydoabsidia padenii]